MSNTEVLINSQTTVSMATLLDMATSNGGTDLPPAPSVSGGRVWPAGQEWVAEVGMEPVNRALDRLYPNQTEASAAIRDAIEAERDRLAEGLRAAGGILAKLAETRDRWETPQLHIWDSADQREPRIVAFA